MGVLQFIRGFVLPIAGSFGLLLNSVHAQSAGMFNNNFNKIVSKTPESSSLQSFVNLPAASNTGIPDISIPLYTINIGSYSLPITMRYQLSGFKQTDFAGAYGYRWVLDAGGMVGRDVNGSPDEEWYFPNYYDIPAKLNIMRMSEDEGSQSQILLEQLTNNRIDINLDSYTLNLPGLSGNLMYRNGQFYTEADPQKTKISHAMPNGFTVTDDQGNIYETGNIAGTSNFVERTQNSVSAIPGSFDPMFKMPGLANTGWKLRKIHTFENRDINFDYTGYTSGTNNVIASENFLAIISQSGEPLCGCNTPPSSITTNYSAATYYTKLVSQITTDNEIVEFVYDDEPSGMSKKRLKSISVKQIGSNNLIRYISFEYGLINNSLASLETINFHDVTDLSKKQSHHFYYNNFNGLTPYVDSYSKDLFGYYNGAVNSRLITSTDPTYTNVWPSANRIPSFTQLQYGALNKIVYPTGGDARFTYELNQYGNKYAPGIRLKEIKRYQGNTLIDWTKYSYFNLKGGVTPLPSAMSRIEDGSSCTRKYISSEYPFDERLGQNYYYDSVVTTRVDPANNANNLMETQKYADFISCSNHFNPYLTRKIIMKGVDNTPWQITQNEYLDSYIDTLSLIKYKSLGARLSSKPSSDPFPYCYNNYIGYQDIFVFNAINNYLTATTTTDFSLTGHLTKTTNYQYGNPLHTYPTSISSIDSKGAQNVQYNVYPEDKTALQNPAPNTTEMQAIDAMIMLHQKNRLLENSVLVDGSSINRVRANYHYQAGTDLILPSNLVNYFPGNISKEKYAALSFDQEKVAEYIDETGIRTSMIYDYHQQYVVAQVTNASRNQIAYTSFEAEGTGGWIYNPGYTIINNSDYGTGRKSYSGTMHINVPIDNYTVTMWAYRYGTALVNGIAGIGSVVRGNWQLFTWTLNGVSSIDVAADNMDEVRLFPQQAQMVSFTYDPLVGISSQTDANGRTLYYEYDGFNRLHLVKNQDKNIVKMICYNYEGQVEYCGTYTGQPNWVSMGNFRCPIGTGGYLTGHREQQEQDTNPSSPTYTNTRWNDIGIDPGACPTNPDWQNTATPVRCKQTASGVNTGEQEQEQLDHNPYSVSFNATRWTVTGINLTACPTPLIYAKIELSNINQIGVTTTARVTLRFYSDQYCSIPVSVNNLSVNYKRVKKNCFNQVTGTTNYATTCSGYSLIIGDFVVASSGAGSLCYSYVYSTTPGTGYVDK